MPVLIGLLGGDGQDLAITANQLVTEAEVELRDNNGSVMVNLREPTTQLAFTGLTEKPVVSFLRQFSAPVKCNMIGQQRSWISLQGTIRTDLCVGMPCNPCGCPTLIEGAQKPMRGRKTLCTASLNRH